MNKLIGTTIQNVDGDGYMGREILRDLAVTVYWNPDSLTYEQRYVLTLLIDAEIKRYEAAVS